MKKALFSIAAVPLFAWVTGCNPTVQNNTTELEGRWLSNCYYDPADNNYDRFDLTYTGEAVTIIATSYDTPECETPTIRLDSSGTFRLGDEIQLASGDTVVKIDYRMRVRGQNVRVLDIIKFEENAYRHGIITNPFVRPRELDDNVIFIKQ